MEKGEVLIKVEGVSKKFCKDLKKSLWYGLGDISKSILGQEPAGGLRKDEFWAINNVSFEVRRGECLGLIGHNGAGKSTLLKMLNGLIRPDQGRIEMKGKIGALIELGAGFNSVLSGRENVYNNGAVLGFSKGEVDKKFDEIVAFAELEDFIDMPVQNYSSGMRVRLGFAIAAQMEPDILLIDEVLAVGDMGFVLKCYNQMDKLLKNTAIILVSHSMPQIARMSTKILLLDKGETMYHSNEVSMGLTEYYKRFKSTITDFRGSEKAILKSISISAEGRTYSREEEIVINFGGDFNIILEIEAFEPIYDPNIYLVFYDNEQRGFAEVFNFKECVKVEGFNKNIFKIVAYIKSIPFTQGKYSITVGFSENVNGSIQAIFREQSCISFNIHGGYHGWTPVQIIPSWKVSAINQVEVR